jgi:transglutaminase-like putative cysteine protease
VSVDPTYDVRPGEWHVTLALGRDCADVAPVKGIALSGGRQTVRSEVRVQAPVNVPPEPATTPGRSAAA